MPARSIAQQRFMGMVHAEKEGKLDKSKLDPEFAAKIERIAASIKAKAAREYAETKHKNLPKKVKEKSPPEGDSRGQNKKAEYIMEKLSAVNKQLSKLTQETYKYFRFVKKESDKMARIKAADARDNSNWPKYVLDKVREVKKSTPTKVVPKKKSKPKQLELFKSAAKKKGKKKSKYSVKDTLAVTGAGVVSNFLPGLPLQAGVAAKKAPKGKKARAASGAFWGSMAGAAPATAVFLGAALAKKGPAKKLKVLLKSPKLKNFQNFKGSLKNLGGPFKKYMKQSAIGHGVGAGVGYNLALKDRKPGPKRKRKSKK